jgi:tRNA1Val (adenine37-N6)-methyltransferase
VARRASFEHPLLGPLTDDLLTRDVRVLQRLRGHRFSSDDVATAYVAARACPSAVRLCDLGTGLGSVLLQLLWKLPRATGVGVEAQAESFALLQENVARNGYCARTELLHADLRSTEASAFLAGAEPDGFDLVTGTPPYFPPGTAVAASDRQRTLARIEERGGVEAYVEVGAKVLAARGTLVLCGDSRARTRVYEATRRAGLALAEEWDAIGRFGRAPLFSVWVLRGESEGRTRHELLLRDAAGEPGPGAAVLRAFGGFDAPPFGPALRGR